MKPRLLDLFCGAGGAAMGYHRAGFEVVGVDIKPQKHYPFEFHQVDAFDAMRYLRDGLFGYFHMCKDRFVAIHASPPCQHYSFGTPDKAKHKGRLPEVRELLKASGLPWVIENVPGAPISGTTMICGCQVGLPLIRRRRFFELSIPFYALMPPCRHDGPVITVTGHGTTSGNRKTWGRNIKVAEMREAMGINWMNRDELSQAIPPAYTEYIGKQLMEYLIAKGATP